MRKNILLEYAHALLKTYVSQDDIVIDATMGNGFDTHFIAGIAKEVYAFDIQTDALLSTKEKVKDMPNVHLILDSHEHINKYVSHFKGVIFNLGYLPKGNQEITTKASTTLKTLETILPHIKKEGFIQIVCYPGHPEGQIEDELIQNWLKTLKPYRYQIIQSHFQDETKRPPYLIMIHKTKDESD